MGKKKQFIDKKASQHFHVVHRSQQDPAMADPDASQFVLLSSTKKGQEYDGTNYTSVSKESGDDSKWLGGDRVNELGFDNDGYDYNQHMREIKGGGVFLQKGGSATSVNPESDLLSSSRAIIPDSVLPSENESGRMLDAITISQDAMDTEVWNALHEDCVEAEGDFEVMDDDFMNQAAADLGEDAEEEAFDYDAHIARLLAAAGAGPSAPKRKLADGRTGGMVTGSEDEFDEDEEEFDSMEEGEEGVETGGGVGFKGEEYSAEQFKTVLEEYEDEEIGELAHCMDDVTLQGRIGLDASVLDDVMNEFLLENTETPHAQVFAGGPGVPGVGGIVGESPEGVEESKEGGGNGEGAGGEEEGDYDEDEAMDAFDTFDGDVIGDNEYLKPKEEEEAWDCETIVSTYSTLDNNPSTIAEPSRRTRKRQQRLAAELEKQRLAAELEVQKEAARRTAWAENTTGPDVPQIQLSTKTGLPLGVFTAHGRGAGEEEESEGEEEVIVNQGEGRRGDETKEEKKARKERVKAERKAKRERKKGLKGAYKEAEGVVKRGASTPQLGKGSVFTYS